MALKLTVDPYVDQNNSENDTEGYEISTSRTSYDYPQINLKQTTGDQLDIKIIFNDSELEDFIYMLQELSRGR